MFEFIASNAFRILQNEVTRLLNIDNLGAKNAHFIDKFMLFTYSVETLLIVFVQSIKHVILTLVERLHVVQDTFHELLQYKATLYVVPHDVRKGTRIGSITQEASLVYIDADANLPAGRSR